MKRLVICSPYHTSITNPRSIRIRNLIRQIESSCNYIYLTNPTEYDSEYKPNYKLHGVTIKQQKGKSTSTNTLEKILKFILWPDPFIINSLYHTCLYLLKYKSKNDILLTVSNPVSSHFIGIISKIFFSKSIYWIADIGDLFSVSDVSYLRFATDYLERKIIQNADRAVINSQGLFNILKSRYSEYYSKFVIISNGSSLEFEKIKSNHHSFIQVNYIGNTYLPIRPGIQELEILSKVQHLLMSKDCKIKINLFGRQHKDLMNFSYDSDISFHPFVETTNLVNVYSQTNILFSLANKDYYTLPSKLEEYCMSGLPIIYFCYNSQDCGIDYLSKKSNVFIYMIGTNRIMELSDFILQHQSAGINSSLYSGNGDKLWIKLLEDLNNS